MWSRLHKACQRYFCVSQSFALLTDDYLSRKDIAADRCCGKAWQKTGNNICGSKNRHAKGFDKHACLRGIVSPRITAKAHMPPKANENWKNDTAARPYVPKQASMMST